MPDPNHGSSKSPFSNSAPHPTPRNLGLCPAAATTWMPTLSMAPKPTVYMGLPQTVCLLLRPSFFHRNFIILISKKRRMREVMRMALSPHLLTKPTKPAALT